MSDELIVRHCSPTLAGLKTGNMFSCPFETDREVTEYLREVNNRLRCKGLRAIKLRSCDKKALIYLYRPSRLERDFSDAAVRELLEGFGYCCDCPERCLCRLISRLNKDKGFPHEIGLFLGYPAEDVRGFIENGAACSKCVGSWKVYGDEEAAKKLFRKYKKCTDVYSAHWKMGKPIEKLAVVC